MNRTFHSVVIALLIPWFLLTLGGCGYRFSGDPSVVSSTRWDGVVVKMEGAGVEANPVLAQQLKDRLRILLSIPAYVTQPARATLRLQLEPTSRKRILEDSSGRADQFEMMIKVHPVLEEGTRSRQFPVITGMAKFYEPRAGAATDAVRIKAEQEALDQVVASLGALLASDPEP
ncbi:MAG: hypothetical protein HQL84_00245 [Magnetococcales bacterium]|nr:hypothetical protein [Magnetococcales bacterium]MBF0148458.1 hypothetical protein [Magnetococcales bacterium]MBF0172605.1 hypothetical protein [Magnetococcales bacterium]MBF0346286.1 hypothetical protein [Magnetococcales bacterium]MBF0629945.1 hypothetical protein [Magnetococcales bacterium]